MKQHEHNLFHNIGFFFILKLQDGKVKQNNIDDFFGGTHRFVTLACQKEQ